MRNAIYLDFECLKTKTPTPMLLGVLLEVGGRRKLQQLIVSDELAHVPAGRSVRHATLEAAVRLVAEQAEARDCPVVGWSNFDHDVIGRAVVRDDLKAVVSQRYVNALETARPWKTLVYPDVQIARENAHAPRNTLDKFAALAGYRNVAALRRGEPAKWIRRVMKNGDSVSWRDVLAYNAHDLEALRAIWIKSSSELARWRSYQRASYYVDSDRGRTIQFKAGGKSGRLDALLKRKDVKTWAFVTAWNPGSIEGSRGVNDAAQAKLIATLESMGYPWLTGRGESNDGSWTPEESLLILGISRRKARRLGRRFDQFAILAGRAGWPAKLVSCAAPRMSP